MFSQNSSINLDILSNKDFVKAYNTILQSLNQDTPIFYQNTDKFQITINPQDFDLLQVNEKLSHAIILPYEVSIVNKSFMKTKVYRLVSRKLPNTINQHTNAQFPFTVEIDQTRSFLLYVTIDTLDDIDWLIDNDLAFVAYTDNTTLYEIDFAIRVPDIRGISSFSQFENYIEAKDWYESGVTDFDEIINLSIGIHKQSQASRILNQALIDFTDRSSQEFNSLIQSIQNPEDISELEKQRATFKPHLPGDFIWALLTLEDNYSLKSKMKFNIQRISYIFGILENKKNCGYDEASQMFENQKNSVEVYTGTDITEQRQKLDLLTMQIRIPWFGSEWCIFDVITTILNINGYQTTVTDNQSLKEYVGQHIRSSGISNLTPYIEDVNINYDISSQIKENTYTFTTLVPTGYVPEPDNTTQYGYKIIHADHSILFSDILDTTDFEISFIYHRPVNITSRNFIFHDFKDSFIQKMLSYDWTSYFGGSIDPNIPINLLSTDYTIELQKTNENGDFTYDNTQWVVNKVTTLHLSDEIVESFRITNFEILDDGSGDILLTQTNNVTDIVAIHKIDVFNEGNTYLQLTEAKWFLPTIYPYQEQFKTAFPSFFVGLDTITDNKEFYQSMIKRIDIVSTRTLTPGETGSIFVVVRLNRNILSHYLSQFIEIPYAIKLTFNEDLHYYITWSTNGIISKYLDWKEGKQKRHPKNIMWQQPFSNEIHNGHLPLAIPDDGVYKYFPPNFNYQFSTYHEESSDPVTYPNDFVKTLARMSEDPSTNLPAPIVKPGQYGIVAYPMILPIPEGETNIGSISDLITRCHTAPLNKTTYRIHWLYFNEFFDDILSTYKTAKKLGFSWIPTSGNAHYVTNGLDYTENRIIPNTGSIRPINLEQFTKINAKVTFMFNETLKNVFEYSFPRTISTYETLSDVDKFLQELKGENEEIIPPKEDKPKKFLDKFLYKVKLGEIVGNKPGTMIVQTDYMNLLTIQRHDNFTIKTHSIGPDSPDTYQISIVDPTLGNGEIIIRFLGSDYTFAFEWEKIDERSILENIGNVVIDPDYINLKYIPIDETYSVAISITNPNPFPLDITSLPMANDSMLVVEMVEFPENEYLNLLYHHWKVLNKPYKLQPNETVKLVLRIIPRRIGVNFHTLYLKIGNSIRTVDIEFNSFVNNKPYFVLDEESRIVDFGDVPIGKIEEKSIIIKNIGDVIGKINSVYTFGNDAQHFKLLDPRTGEIAERLSFNKIVKPKTSLHVPIRFYSQSYGLNTSYAYIETNEPVVDQWQIFDDSTQLFRNAPKYLSTLLRAQVVLEDDPVDLDTYIFLGYVHPTRSRFRTYELTLNNKSSDKIISIQKIDNYMKNYIKIKYSQEPFSQKTSVYITLNPRSYSENIYFDQLFVWYSVYDKKTHKRRIVLKKIPISWQVTSENYYEFDINASELILVTKPFIKTMKVLHVTNFSNVDATMEISFLNDFSGLYSIVPHLIGPVLIPEGVRYTFRILFGGDQRFLGKYDTGINILFNIGESTIQKTIALKGLIGEENIIKAYKRKNIIITT